MTDHDAKTLMKRYVRARITQGEREKASSSVMCHAGGRDVAPALDRSVLELALADVRAAKAPLDAAEARILDLMGLPRSPAGTITLKQAAMDWHVSEDSVRRWAINGQIRAEKMMGRWFVHAVRPSK